MKRLLILIFSGTSMAGSGQLPATYILETDSTRTHFVNEPLSTSNVEVVKAYAEQKCPNLAHPRCSAELTSSLASPAGHHIALQQTFSSIPVFGGVVKVNLDKRYHVRALFDRTVDVSDWSPLAFSHTAAIIDESAATAHLREPVVRQNLVIWPATPEVALSVTTFDPATNASFIYVLDAQGETLLKRNAVQRFLPPDSLVDALVFNPDPLTTASQIYGGQYVDLNDTENPVLNAERVQVQMNVQFSGGTFSLENQWVKLADVSAPNIAPPTSLTPDFSFSRGQDGFEDVNAYFHLAQLRGHLDQIGYSSLGNEQILVDAHALDNQDQSVFIATSTPKRLLLGEGGVDDAEDADVIIHEYGHHLAYSAAPNTTIGFERQAVEEGFCDYIAASYSRNISEYNWHHIFSWDGHNPFWPGRVVNSSKVYPNDLGSDLHLAGEIWSAAMMEIWEELGRNYTDQLALQALYSWVKDMTMPEAAFLILQADEALSGGANYDVIYQIFLARGLVGELSDDIVNAQLLLGRVGNPVVTLSAATPEADIEVFDMSGRLIYKEENVKDKFSELPHYLFTSSAMYFIRVTTADDRIIRKVILTEP